MTELLRRIRLMADEVGQARGRPILIAVHSPDSVEYCRAMGLDLEHWMVQDLLDLWMPSGYFQLNDWGYSVALAHRYGVKVYPALHEPRVRPQRPPRAARRCWRIEAGLPTPGASARTGFTCSISGTRTVPLRGNWVTLEGWPRWTRIISGPSGAWRTRRAGICLTRDSRPSRR